MEKTCKNCIFWSAQVWGDETSDYRSTETCGRCDAIKHEGDSSEVLTLMEDKPAKNTAVVFDGESYNGGLITGCDFGCVLFQQK